MMMFWQTKHRRFRGQLSLYLDGQLHAADAGRLEAHLSACRSCRTELEQLRGTAAALRSMPQAEAPRSFALSEERAAERQPPRQAAPLAFGVRLATAAVAVAFAAVLVADLSGGGGGSGGAPVTERAGNGQTQLYGDLDANQPEDDAGEDAGSPAVPASEADGTPVTTQRSVGSGGATETPTGGAAPPSADGGAEETAVPAGGDGVDALRAAEIALGVTLALLLLAGGAVAYAGRKGWTR